MPQNAVRQALNSPIQGAAAELTCFALLRIADEIENYGYDAAVVNTVHDSIVVSAPKDQADDVAEMMERVMIQPPFAGFTVPLSVEIEINHRWGGELDIAKIRQVEPEKTT